MSNRREPEMTALPAEWPEDADTPDSGSVGVHEITHFDTVSVRHLADEMRQTVERIAVAHGLALGRVAWSFNVSNFVLKIEVATKATDGKVNSRMREDFTRYAGGYGFKPTDLDRRFVWEGKTYSIVGWRSSASKRPVVIKRVSDGREYVVTPQTVIGQLRSK